MRDKSHKTPIGIIRDYVNQWRKQERWSRETVAQEIVTAHEKSGADVATEIFFDNYVLDSVSEPGRVALAYGYSWPTARTQNNSIKVRYVTGYGLASSVPDGIKHWTLMRIKQLYDQRDSVSTAGNMLEMPYKFVDGLLDSYIVPNFEWDSSCS